MKDERNLLQQEIEFLRATYRTRSDWDCLPELVNKIAVLTGSAHWAPDKLTAGVLLYGAGSIGAGALEYFANHHIKVLGMLDDSPGREGTKYHGLDILPFSFAQRARCPIIVSMKNWLVPATKVVQMGLTCESFANYVVRTNLQKLEEVCRDWLVDDRSRLVYLTILKANVLSDYSLFPTIYEDKQYWAIPEFQYLADANAVMVDAGAYVGQITEEFVLRSHGIFKRIYAFEPNPALHQALQARAERLTREWALPKDAIRCVPAGLGEEASELPFFESGVFNMTGGSFLFAQGSPAGRLEIKQLDSYLAGAPITFLKADVEGFEGSLIRGASNTIRACRPKIAMSIYHRINDMLDIPTMLRALIPDYKMSVRHHTLSQEDSVLYCF